MPYYIKWRSKNGREGRGTLLFSKDKADEIVREMNHDFPEIIHEAVEVPTDSADEVAKDAQS